MGGNILQVLQQDLWCAWLQDMASMLSIFVICILILKNFVISSSAITLSVGNQSNQIKDANNMVRKNDTARYLVCHQCNSTRNGDSCIHLATNLSTFVDECGPNETTCMVSKLVLSWFSSWTSSFQATLPNIKLLK